MFSDVSVHSTWRCRRAAAFMILLGIAAPLAHGTATFTALGDLTPAHVDTQAFGITADGSRVVGVSDGFTGAEGPSTAFQWTQRSGLSALAPPPGVFSAFARDVAAEGEVVAGFGFNDMTLLVPVIWHSGRPVSLQADMFTGTAEGISIDGSVIVGSGIEDVDVTFPGYNAFRVTKEGVDFMPDLAGSSGGNLFFADNAGAAAVSADGSIIVGFGNDSWGNRAVRWTDAGNGAGFQPQPLIPPGQLFAFNSRATGLTPDGSVIIGDGSLPNGLTSAFRWTARDGAVALGELPPDMAHGTAAAVSADGDIIVGSWTNSGLFPCYQCDTSVAFIWDSKNGWRDLKAILETQHGLDLTGWALRYATDISADGMTIVGMGRNPDGDIEGWVVRFQPAIVADLNGDGLVNGLDLGILLSQWAGAGMADLNGDGLVNGVDLGILLANWTL